LKLHNAQCEISKGWKDIGIKKNNKKIIIIKIVAKLQILFTDFSVFFLGGFA